ncbi:MAG: glycosyltransferase family 2 protein, partial [Sciscionella sp.]
LSTGGLNPIGYTLFLEPLLAVSGLDTVAAVQHLIGIGVAVAVYALALRFGARRWLAALAAAPMLLDAYQLQIEQLIMSDLLFEALLVAVVWVLISRGSPTQRRIIVAGLLIGASVTVRSVGITLIVPALAYLVLIGAKWRYPGGWRQIGSRVAAFVVACGVVLAGHAVYSMISTGNPGVTAQTGNVLYGRTAVVADCTKLKLDPYERQMCPDEPLGARMGVDAYAHRDGDANWPAVVPEGTNRSAMMAAFAWDVIKEQPLDVARAILVDFGKGFSPIRSTLPGDVAVERWQFQDYYPLFASQEYTDSTLVRYSGEPASVNTALAGFLRAYQLHGGYTPGPLQAAALVLGLFGSLGVASRGSGMRSTTALVTGLALTLLLTSAAFEFSWRYQLPTVSLLPLAGVLGLTALLGPLRRPKQVKHRPKLTEFPDQVDFAALTEFAERYGEPAMAPVVVVIAAYNEESGIGSVLDDVPKRALDMDVDVLVVSDGSRDATATVAREHGAYVCLAPRNRGQGAALRLAYRLAAAHGARYVVSTDADGQYDNTELDKLLCPLV